MKVRRVLELMMLRSSPQDGGSLGFCAILVDHFTSRKPVQRSVVKFDDLRCNHVWSHILSDARLDDAAHPRGVLDPSKAPGCFSHLYVR